MNRQTQAALLLLAALGWSSGAGAAAPGDPTEAPPMWVITQPVAPGTAPIETSGAVPEVGVILSGKSRRLAVIDGEVVKVGDQVKGSKVVAIRATKVVTQDATKSLYAMPNVSKTKPVPVPARKKRVVLPADVVSTNRIGSPQ